MASGGRRKQSGEATFTDERYQMALFKRSCLIIIFHSIGDQHRKPSHACSLSTMKTKSLLGKPYAMRSVFDVLRRPQQSHITAELTTGSSLAVIQLHAAYCSHID